MNIFLIDNKSNWWSVLFWLNVFVFSCAINLCIMPGSSGLPSSFATEPVLSEITTNVGSVQTQSTGPETVAVSDETVGDQGNWVKKKQWLLKSFEVNNNIYNLAIQIADTRNIYSGKNDAISDELQAFYKKLGLGQGKLQELFEGVERYLDKKKAKDLMAVTGGNGKPSEVGDRDNQIKIELLDNQVKQLKDELEQLKLDMKSIEDIGKSLSQRLEKVDEQIVAAMNLAESAKSKVEDLWVIIDDKKARMIYYDLANIEENLKVILSYLKETLAADFDVVIQNVKKQIEVTNEEVKKLEESGVIIKDRATRIEKLKLQEIQKLEHEKSLAEVPAQVQKNTKIIVEDKTKNIGWRQKFYNFCIDVYIKIYGYFSSFCKAVHAPAHKKIDVKPVVAQGQAKTQPTQPSQLPAPDQGSTFAQTQAKPATPLGPEVPSPSQSDVQQPAVSAMQLIQ